MGNVISKKQVQGEHYTEAETAELRTTLLNSFKEYKLKNNPPKSTNAIYNSGILSEYTNNLNDFLMDNIDIVIELLLRQDEETRQMLIRLLDREEQMTTLLLGEQ